MYDVRTRNGKVIQLDFDAMTDKELDDLEISVFTYKRERKEKNIQKSINTIIDCIEAEIEKCPALKYKTAIATDEEDIEWFDLLCMMKDTD